MVTGWLEMRKNTPRGSTFQSHLLSSKEPKKGDVKIKSTLTITIKVKNNNIHRISGNIKPNIPAVLRMRDRLKGNFALRKERKKPTTLLKTYMKDF